MLPSDDGRILKRLVAILKDPDHGQAIQHDLRSGLSTLPDWMRVIVRDLFQRTKEKERVKAAQSAEAGIAGNAPKIGRLTRTRGSR